MKDKSFFFHRVEIRPRTPGPRLLGRATHGEGAPVDAHHAATVSVLREHQHAEPEPGPGPGVRPLVGWPRTAGLCHPS